MSEVQRWQCQTLGKNGDGGYQMLRDDQGQWVTLEDYQTLQSINRSFAKSILSVGNESRDIKEEKDWLHDLLVYFKHETLTNKQKSRLVQFISDIGEEDVRYEMVFGLLHLAAFCANDRSEQYSADAHSLRKDGRQSEATYDDVMAMRLAGLVEDINHLRRGLIDFKSEAEYFCERIDDLPPPPSNG